MCFSQFRSEHENILISKEKLIDFIDGNLHGIKLEPVLGDSMCMIRSLKDLFGEEFPVESITKPLQRELLTNHGFYQQFSVDNIDVLVELEKFWTIH